MPFLFTKRDFYYTKHLLKNSQLCYDTWVC
ncbi:hypothetical protein Acal01_02031 [Acinetobacter calcoaceticus]|uniref:Uncharacterized protein n=1 Tax=Acinetobacter calcoaceticus DSM 30006 = CIP 81.8 TaxID=981331 RepID=A0ABN0KCL7_ACICA|nr:hypothetical protein F997_00731 [Acinetobacter calcoaceticus NIPH 13]ENW02036.1 hypothetical protein F936_00396 [Acinetobacter calcoaceticus DSM 30006 = CIP 81.8]MDR6796721.1 hypothetical protein [Acinetobacter calcoaceticus]CAI3131896.1 hypothetical protein MWMV17_MWMV17_01648 [Acinetobacter calcoaceticus]SUU66481.1 Uncharacterised protein [Acinetobacter calcoaceticus]